MRRWSCSPASRARLRPAAIWRLMWCRWLLLRRARSLLSLRSTADRVRGGSRTFAFRVRGREGQSQYCSTGLWLQREVRVVRGRARATVRRRASRRAAGREGPRTRPVWKRKARLAAGFRWSGAADAVRLDGVGSAPGNALAHGGSPPGCQRTGRDRGHAVHRACRSVIVKIRSGSRVPGVVGRVGGCAGSGRFDGGRACPLLPSSSNPAPLLRLLRNRF